MYMFMYGWGVHVRFHDRGIGTWTILWWLVVQEVRDHKCFGGDGQDPAPWTSIKWRYENQAQPVLIGTRRSFFPYNLRTDSLSLLLSFLRSVESSRNHEASSNLVACRRGRLRSWREGGRTSQNIQKTHSCWRSSRWVYFLFPVSKFFLDCLLICTLKRQEDY